MKEITQIKLLGLLIFLIPFISINVCLLVSVNYEFFNNTFFSVDQIGRSAYSFPYLDGGLSISRASRTFPQYLIFKPSMFITSILLCFYWYKNNLLINTFKNTSSKKNNFMYYGILSATFLIIHSFFLGVKTDIEIFKFLKRVFLIGFIAFEVTAQTLLVNQIYKLRDKIKNYFIPIVLKLKILLVSILLLVAIINIPLLMMVDAYANYKHALEWNYFICVILYYFLVSFFWKKIS